MPGREMDDDDVAFVVRDHNCLGYDAVDAAKEAMRKDRDIRHLVGGMTLNIDDNEPIIGHKDTKKKKLTKTATNNPSIKLSTGMELSGGVKGVSEIKAINLAFHRDIDDYDLELIGYRCPRLVSVDFSGCPNLTDSGVAKLLANCPHLATLFLYGNDLSDKSIFALANKKDIALKVFGPPRGITREMWDLLRGRGVDVIGDLAEGTDLAGTKSVPGDLRRASEDTSESENAPGASSTPPERRGKDDSDKGLWGLFCCP